MAQAGGAAAGTSRSHKRSLTAIAGLQNLLRHWASLSIALEAWPETPILPKPSFS